MWICRIVLTICVLIIHEVTIAQSFKKTFNNESRQKYNSCFDELKRMIETNELFLKAVSLFEKMYDTSSLSIADIEFIIDDLGKLVMHTSAKTTTTDYHQPDSSNYLLNHSTFSQLFDSTLMNLNKSRESHQGIAFSYDTNNLLPQSGGMFVTVSTLLTKGKGDCRSLSYLYKIVADKIGAKCWLSLAPNHIYIKNFSQQYGWYNTELTSRSFPTDAWIMASGYISADAVRSRLYMDTLSNQQSIGLCVLDLAKGYEYETKNYYDGFILKCCDLVLQYHVTNPMALLLRAETLKKVYLKQKEENAPTMKQAYNDMEAAYITLARLHYREMPKEMYLKWVEQMQQQRNQ